MTAVLPKSDIIKTTRIKNGLSLRGLGLKTNTHYSTISNIENAKGSVTPRTAKAICEALGREFDELFEIVETKMEA